MTAFLLHRIALILPTLFFVSVLIFGLQQLLRATRPWRWQGRIRIRR